MNKFIKRGITTILAMTLAVCTPMISVYANAESVDEPVGLTIVDESSESISSVLSENDIPECLALEASENSKLAARLYEKETSLDTVLFANKDGSETVYIFNEDVKYIDESGNIADKSNKLYSNIESRAYSTDYSYVNKENDINTYCPKSLKTDVGVSVEAQGQVIEMYPVSDVVSQVIADNDMYGVYYDDVFGEFTGIRYKPSFSGYKEDIVLEKNVGNKFGFILETGDLVPVLENGVVYLRDESGADFGLISPTYVYDSFTEDPSLDENRHFTYNNKFELTRISDGEYELVVIVDEDFLNNPATVYPVIVDPSITINATGSGSKKSILDTPIYNGDGAKDKSAGYNQLSVIGCVDSSYGTGRLLMRFPGLINRSFMNSKYTISSAAITMNECSGGSASSTVCVYNYTGPAWDESTTYSSYVYNGVGSSIASRSFSYPNYITGSYDITSAVKSWQLDSSKGDKGIIFKNTTSESDYSKTKSFYTAEGATKPYLSVTYFYNGCRNYVRWPSSNQEEKKNCFAFAFNQSSDTFGMETYEGKYFNISDFIYCANKTTDEALKRTKDKLEVWLADNFPGKWQDVTSYGYNYSLNSNQWLVAMRVGNRNNTYDYHFWYRASDGKWYNKHGTDPSKEVSNNVINPSIANESDGWKLGTVYYYDSDTVYYAITQ